MLSMLYMKCTSFVGSTRTVEVTLDQNSLAVLLQFCLENYPPGVHTPSSLIEGLVECAIAEGRFD